MSLRRHVGLIGSSHNPSPRSLKVNPLVQLAGHFSKTNIPGSSAAIEFQIRNAHFYSHNLKIHPHFVASHRGHLSATSYSIMTMTISVEAIIAIVGLFITLPPSMFILWKVLRTRNRRSANLGRMIPSIMINYGRLMWVVSDYFNKQIQVNAKDLTIHPRQSITKPPSLPISISGSSSGFLSPASLHVRLYFFAVQSLPSFSPNSLSGMLDI